MSGSCIKILGAVGAPAQYGLGELMRAMRTAQMAQTAQTAQGGVFSGKIIAGTLLGSEAIRRYAADGAVGVEAVSGAYGIGVRQDSIVVAGYDDAGLMYACLSLAQTLGGNMPPKTVSEKPYLKTRGIFEFAHNRDLEAERFYSKEYWTAYFDMLARCRINAFNYVFSHQSSYQSPVFAYFMRDSKYPGVKPTDIDSATIDKNYEMMGFITRLAQERGISFILGIWQICPWNEKTGRHIQPCNVAGLTDDILEDYVYRGAKAMLTDFPGIAGIQVRVNNESGIPREFQTRFFRNTIFKAVAETGRLMDYRGWLAEPETTAGVKEMCPDLRVSMKYWAEFLGPPYQPCKIRPEGYSYGNLLDKPMDYRFLWQVWALGSPRLLLWGDPDYVRRLVHSCRLGGAEGFEINPPLAQKGYGNEPGHWRIFKHRGDEYYTHEYERYWMFYLLFGRLAYNPDTAPDVWMGELGKRLGDDNARHMIKGYSLSSRVITFLVQYSLSDPNMYIWPEIDTGGLLEFYIETPTSDRCVISTIPEYIQNTLGGLPSGKLAPERAAAMFRRWGDEILESVDRCASGAECAGGAGGGEGAGSRPGGGDKELRSSMTDFRIMAYLARYHAYKIEAGTRLAAYFATGDGSGLAEARRLLSGATSCWAQMVALSENVYYDDMVTGPSNAGSWKKRLGLVYEDELRLAEIEALHERYGLFCKGFDFGPAIDMQGLENGRFEILGNFSVERGFLGVDADTFYGGSAGYGWTHEAKQGDGFLVSGVAMAYPRLTDKSTDAIWRRDAIYEQPFTVSGGYRSPLYEDYLSGTGRADFACDLPDGDYSVTLVFCDMSAEARPHGPFNAYVCGQAAALALRVMPFERIEKTVDANVAGGKLTVGFEGLPPSDAEDSRSGDWFISAIIIKNAAPSIAHMPPRSFCAGRGQIVRATATAPNGAPDEVSIVIDGSKVPMGHDGGGHYSADISHLIKPGGTAAYTIEAARAGKQAKSAEYRVPVGDGFESYAARHSPPAAIKNGTDFTVAVEAAPPERIKAMYLWYSQTNQYADMVKAEMAPAAAAYAAVIPGSYITPNRDILYYFEIIGHDNSGTILPDFREQTPYYTVEVES